MQGAARELIMQCGHPWLLSVCDRVGTNQFCKTNHVKQTWQELLIIQLMLQKLHDLKTYFENCFGYMTHKLFGQLVW